MPNKTIRLYGEQNRVLFLPPRNAIQIKGVAGSGKTTVALFRALHLLDSYKDLFVTTNVCVFVYNKILVKYLNTLVVSISCIAENINQSETIPKRMPIITTFHSWAYHFLKSKGIALNTIDEQNRNDSIAIIKYRYPSALKHSTEFYSDEFKWIKGKNIRREEEYLNVARKGRGTTDRVTKTDRTIIWKMFSEYNEYLISRSMVDFDDYALKVLDYMESHPELEHPYSHIVVDEAQDLTKAEMLVITKLVSPSTNSITIVADSAQRIYKSGFVWSEIGLNFTGRSMIFNKNYRNTKQIVESATSLLNHETDKTDFVTPLPPVRNGAKPFLGIYDSTEAQDSTLKKILSNLGENIFSTVILAKNYRSISEICTFLKKEKKEYNILVNANEKSVDESVINICTLPSIKGLEFDNVIIIDLNDKFIPSISGMDGEEKEVQISTDRRLLYTAMTRAKERLYLLSSGQPSPFLKEIDRNTITTNLQDEI